MIKRNIFLLFFLCISCTSDEIIRSEKAAFYSIYKNIIVRDPQTRIETDKRRKENYDRKWLSQFNQPIISLSSLDGRRRATLIALGNYKNKLTWVSADGISVSFKDGVLIATRGYSQDLMESKHENLNTIFNLSTKSHNKTYRYLDGQNEYNELSFSCSISLKKNISAQILDLNLKTTELTEICTSNKISHTNLYYLLPGTKIVLKSKQWVSETNGYIIIHNYYAFQNNLF